MREDGGHRTGGGDRVPECVVGVFGDEAAVLVPVADHVPVVVVGSQARLRLRLYGASRGWAGRRIRKRYVGEYVVVHQGKSHGILLLSVDSSKAGIVQRVRDGKVRIEHRIVRG